MARPRDEIVCERIAQAQATLARTRQALAFNKQPLAGAELDELRDILTELEDLCGVCTPQSLFES